MIDGTLIMGCQIFKLEELSSTNTFLMQKLKNENLQEGTVAWALSQTEGRGQRGNIWLSEAGKNLTFSLLLKPTFLPIKNQFLISMAFSIAVIECIRENYEIEAEIKWPNDIYIEDKKVGGILIENMLSGNALKNVVIGLGLNVNQEKFNIEKATSLKQFSGQNFSIEELLNKLLSVFEKYYFMLRSSKFETIKQAYINHLKGFEDFLMYQDVETKEITELKIIDVAYDGTAIFSNRNNQRYAYKFKEVILV